MQQTIFYFNQKEMIEENDQERSFSERHVFRNQRKENEMKVMNPEQYPTTVG